MRTHSPFTVIWSLVLLGAAMGSAIASAAPPTAPASPSPANLSTGRPLLPTLTWTATDPEAGPLTYDLYFGESSVPPLVASGLTNTSYQPAVLDILIQYYWQVVARDQDGEETAGPLWRFTTTLGSAPSFPTQTSPPHQSVIGNQFPTLTWTCTEPDGQPLMYEVFFGPQLLPPSVGFVTSPQYSPPGPLFPQKYYWYIVANDGHWFTSSLMGWNFTVDPALPVKSSTWGAIKALYAR